MKRNMVCDQRRFSKAVTKTLTLIIPYPSSRGEGTKEDHKYIYSKPHTSRATQSIVLDGRRILLHTRENATNPSKLHVYLLSNPNKKKRFKF